MFSPLDPLLAVLYAALRVPSLRVLLLTLGLGPAVLYAMPPTPCGCLPAPFRRCSGGGREGAYRAGMKSDLKNLASQEEIFYADHSAYSASFEDLGFVTSNGVRVTVQASADGWAAWASHDALGAAALCAMYYGDLPAHGITGLNDALPGEVVCPR